MHLRLGHAVLALAFAAGAACQGGAPEPPAGWHVAGGFLRDPEGRAAVLRGANVSGRHKDPPYFDFHELPDYQRMRDEWGMNAVRFLIEWAALEPEEGVYDAAYLDEVARRVGLAEQAGLLVVMDMHQDVYGPGFGVGNGAPRWTCDEAHYLAFTPVTPWYLNYQDEHVLACYDHLWATEALAEHYAEAWRRVAERLAGSAAVVGFDVMNEPHWGSYPVWSFEEDRLRPFYERVVLAVRSAAPEWVAFLEPSSSRNLGFATGFTGFSVPNVVYAPHSYDAEAESGGGFSEARRAAILQNVALLAGEAAALDAALWIGEFGGVADAPGIGAYMDAQYDAAAAVAAGGAYWHYGRDDGYGLLRPDGTEKAELLDAVARPFPARIAGDPVSWSFDEATRVFTLVFRPDAAARAPTELAVPARAYPAGWDEAATPAGSDGTATITVTPR